MILFSSTVLRFSILLMSVFLSTKAVTGWNEKPPDSGFITLREQRVLDSSLAVSIRKWLNWAEDGFCLLHILCRSRRQFSRTTLQFWLNVYFLIEINQSMIYRSIILVFLDELQLPGLCDCMIQVWHDFLNSGCSANHKGVGGSWCIVGRLNARCSLEGQTVSVMTGLTEPQF